MSEMIYCGGKTCHGHGDYAVCGNVYWHDVYQCDSCRAKQKERIVEELEQQLAESHRALRAETTAHENTQMQLEKIAAELSAIDSIHDDAVFITDERYEQCPPEVQKIIRSLAVLQIPAHRAFLAEVRAQGVDALVERRLTAARLAKENGHEITARDLEGEAIRARVFAMEIRKGVQS